MMSKSVGASCGMLPCTVLQTVELAVGMSVGSDKNG